jgi:signal transduction histidine kinase
MGIDYLTTAVSWDERTGSVLESMEDAVTRADSIIRGLLDYSVVSDIVSEECSIHDIIAKSINLVKHELDKKNIRLVKDLSRDGHLIRLDAEKICQVFVNLMLNAIHATPDEGTITVTTHVQMITEHDTSKSYVAGGKLEIGDRVIIVEIADTGHGIPDDQLVKVFDPFFTVNPSGKGTGLGLTVTKNIIESHGGIIDITNRKEGGVSSIIVLKM